jgi:tetratricopeptide (TPR) repeat protein
VEFRTTLALALAANELWVEARDAFGAAVEIDPDPCLPRYYEAVAAQKTGDHEAALSLLRDTTVRCPDFAPAHHRRGELELDRGQLDEAEASFKLATQYGGRAPEGFIGLADVRVRRSDFDGARRLAEKALGIAPKNSRAHYVLGLALRGLGKEAEARDALEAGKSFSRAYMSEPWQARMKQHDKSASGQVALAISLAQKGDHDGARRMLLTTLKYHPGDFSVLNNLGIGYLSQKQPRKALEYCKRAEKVAPKRATVQLSLGTIYDVLGDRQTALRHAQRARELDPDDPRIDRLLERLRGGGRPR